MSVQPNIPDIVDLYLNGILTVEEMLEEMDRVTGLHTQKTSKQAWDLIHIASTRWDDELPLFFFVHLIYSEYRIAVREIIHRERLIEYEKNHYYRQVAEACYAADRRDLKVRADLLYSEINKLGDLMGAAKDGLKIYLTSGEKVRLETVAWYQDEIHTKAKLLDIIDTFL